MDLSVQNAAQSYATATEISKPAGQSMGQAAEDFLTALQQNEAAITQGLVGQGDPHTLVQALAQTEIAVQTAATVRDRVVEAYQEILRMPV
ncbi:MAG: flagellar hook-basal body complex protein FliE [Pseudomonadota bacterium]